jgi:protease PrsW
MDILGIPLGLLPVLAFLGLLSGMDSFKLVPPRALSQSLLWGCVAAALALWLNTQLLDRLSLDLVGYRRYDAPLLEEALKASFLIFLIRTNRVGFMVDAAIHGFAVGAGFALVENVHFLLTLGERGVFLWIVRGFGTAVMHGSTMAIFATLAKSLTDRTGGRTALAYVPGFLAAVLLHSLFNHFFLPPLAMTIVMLVLLPLLVILVFERSERRTRDWLGTGFDSHLDLLECIWSGDVGDSHVGRYLQSLRGHFPPAVVADMLCYLQVYLELSMRAKALLIARQAGVRIPLGDDIHDNLRELRFLEKSIGRTGQLALQPLLGSSRRELWQLGTLAR